MKKNIFYLLFILTSFSVTAQNNSLLLQYEDSLRIYRNKILQAENFQLREVYNRKFIALLEHTIPLKNSLDYPFDSLSYFGIIDAPDGSFRLYNWNVPTDEETHIYYCYIQQKINPTQFISLHDYSDKIKSPKRKTLNKDKWFGALYYNIIPMKKKRKKQQYILLAWDGNNQLTSKKIIEVLSFDSKGNPKFGASIFKQPKESNKRIIFEYSTEAQMSLKYEKKKKLLVFDHLVPKHPELVGAYQFYVPDLTFDAFELKKGKWIYIPDIDIRLPKSHKPFNRPRDNK